MAGDVNGVFEKPERLSWSVVLGGPMKEPLTLTSFVLLYILLRAGCCAISVLFFDLLGKLSTTKDGCRQK